MNPAVLPRDLATLQNVGPETIAALQDAGLDVIDLCAEFCKRHHAESLLFGEVQEESFKRWLSGLVQPARTFQTNTKTVFWFCGLACCVRFGLKPADLPLEQVDPAFEFNMGTLAPLSADIESLIPMVSSEKPVNETVKQKFITQMAKHSMITSYHVVGRILDGTKSQRDKAAEFTSACNQSAAELAKEASLSRGFFGRSSVQLDECNALIQSVCLAASRYAALFLLDTTPTDA